MIFRSSVSPIPYHGDVDGASSIPTITGGVLSTATSAAAITPVASDVTVLSGSTSFVATTVTLMSLPRRASPMT